MPGAYVQNAQNSTAQNSTTTVASGSITQAGANLNIYLAFYDGSGTGGTEPTITPSDTLGNAYTKIQSIWDATNLLKAEWGYAKNIAAGSNALTVTYGGGVGTSYFKGCALFEYSGLSTTAPFVAGEFNGQEQNIGAITTDGLVSGNTAALIAQPALIVGFSSIAHNTSGSPAVGTGFSANGAAFWLFGTGANFAQMESKRVTATGAYQATFTPAALANHFTMVMALHEDTDTLMGQICH